MSFDESGHGVHLQVFDILYGPITLGVPSRLLKLSILGQVDDEYMNLLCLGYKERRIGDYKGRLR